MPSVAGSLIRLLATVFYGLEFCCAGIILGIYSYFLSVLADRDIPIARDWKAVEGLSGVAVVYTIAAVIFTFCLGGIKFFAFLAILLDICFVGAFIALAVLTRDGTESCSANPVNTPIGRGAPDSSSGYGPNGFGSNGGENVTYSASFGLACRLNKACFAVSIIGAIAFLISAFLQVWVSRHHQKEKRFGPSPANNYTSGSGKRKFWQRKPKGAVGDGFKDAEMAPAHDNAGGATLASDSSAPYNAAPNAPASYNSAGYTNSGSYTTSQPTTASYGTGAVPHDHSGYHTGPVGTSVNPYGYDANRPTASNF